MFPGLELTNDDNGVNTRPLPILDIEQQGFFTAHTYHLDIRFEAAFTQMGVLADAILNAVQRGKRVIVEHFDMIYPFLKTNANLLIGMGEEIIITRPTIFGPLPNEIYDIVAKSVDYRRMAHTAEDLCEIFLPAMTAAGANTAMLSTALFCHLTNRNPSLILTSWKARFLMQLQKI